MVWNTVYIVLDMYSNKEKKERKKNLFYTVSRYYIQHIVLQTNYKNRSRIFKYIFTVFNIEWKH